MPFIEGVATTNTTSACVAAVPCEMVALFDVDRATRVLTLDISVDVAHDDAVGAPQRVERGFECPGTNRGPETRSPEPQEELVLALGDGERERAHLVHGWCSRSVRFDQLLHAGDDVAGVVKHGLLGVQAEIDEEDETGVSHVVRERLRQRDRRGGASRAAGARDRRDDPAPFDRCGVVRRRTRVLPGDGSGVLGQHRQQLVPSEVRSEERRRAQGDPVTRHAQVLDHEDGDAGAPRGSDEVAVDLGKRRVGDQCRERTS